MMMTEIVNTTMRCTMQVTKTMNAVRRLGCLVCLVGGERGVAVGKKSRKRRSLSIPAISICR